MSLTQYLDEELTVHDIYKHFQTCVSAGGRAGVCRILDIARNQIKLRPTGGEAIALMIFFAAYSWMCFEFYRVVPLWITAYRGAQAFVIAVYILGAYLIGSLRLDILDHRENREIRAEAKKAVTAILDKPGPLPAPLEDSAYRYLKELGRGDRRFRRAVKPLLRAGIDPRDCLDFDTLEANEEQALASQGIHSP